MEKRRRKGSIKIDRVRGEDKDKIKKEDRKMEKMVVGENAEMNLRGMWAVADQQNFVSL